jgi:hypothetical protein
MNDMTVIVEENAMLARIYARMPVEVQLSFTSEQMAALGLATYETSTPHKVAIRKTVGLFGRRYYFALFMGRDRRETRSALKEYADEFRADWRYIVSMFFILVVSGGVLALAASTAWSYAAMTVGGPYRPISINEFLPK